jgi:hypothetical protein
MSKPKKKKLIETCVSFRQIFCDKEKKEGVKGTKAFYWKKIGPSCHIMREKENLKLPYLNNRFQQVARL